MDLYDIAIARALSSGGGGGGGGSSDFSTAEVTIVDNDGNGVTLTLPHIVNYEGLFEGIEVYAKSYESGTYPIVIYKDGTVVELFDVTGTNGQIANPSDDFYNITGDCTITFGGK